MSPFLPATQSGPAGEDAGQVGPLIGSRFPFQHFDSASQLGDELDLG